jgi:hypothetical protein
MVAVEFVAFATFVVVTRTAESLNIIFGQVLTVPCGLGGEGFGDGSDENLSRNLEG